MGVINYTTAKINELLDKIDKAPEKIENGKTPVFVTGTTTTLDPGLSATAEVVQDGVDEKWKSEIQNKLWSSERS